jgi:hypothetical protein
MQWKRWILAAAVLVLLPQAAARAAGPVDVEVGIAYWDAKEETTGEPSVDASDVGGWVELGLSRFAFALSQWRVSPEDGDADFTALDVKYRVFEPTEGNFIAVGVGGERVNIDGGDFSDSSTSARVLVEGGVSIKIVKIMGRYAYLPSLGDITVGPDTIRGDKGYEAEAMVSVHPAPFFFVHGGYRIDSLDFELPDGSGVTLESKGPFAGVGFKF